MREPSRLMWGQPPSAVRRARPSFHTRLLAVGLACAFALLSCSPRDFLTRRLATDLIASSEAFNAPQQFELRIGVLSSKDYSLPEYLVFLHRGWISGSTIGCPAGTAPPPCWDVRLTASGVETVQAVSPADAGDKSSFTIPVAKRELIGVTGISKQAGSAVVEFAWKWSPLNEIGAALYSGDVHYKSTVGFRQFDDGWRVVQSVAHPVQPMDEALKNAEPAP